MSDGRRWAQLGQTTTSGLRAILQVFDGPLTTNDTTDYIELTGLESEPVPGTDYWNPNTSTFQRGNPTRQVTTYAFLQRFTLDERKAILQRAKSDLQVAVLHENLTLAPELDLDSTDVVTHVGYLQQVGILSDARAALILA